MLQSEMSIQKVVKACEAVNLLHLCFENITEYDPDVVFNKNVIFSAFAQNVAFLWNLLTFTC